MDKYSQINPAANDDKTARNNMMDMWRESIDRAAVARQTVPTMAQSDEEAKADLEQRIRNGQAPCPTCQSRTYQDGSNDPGVSFKTPTHISPGASAGAVMSHEREHVTRNAADAQAKGGTARSTVTLQRGICPECGRSYVKGGLTTTTTSIPQEDPRQKQKDPFSTGLDKQV